MRLVNWNIERRGPQTWQAASLVSEIGSLNPDLVFLTEAHHDSLDALAGHSLSHRGYDSGRKKDSERLVLMWSRSGWEELPLPVAVQEAGGALFGRTEIEGVGVYCLAICIPWHMCPSVKTDGKTVPWAQHVRFLRELAPVLSAIRQRHYPLIVAGDFNRRIPRAWGPIEAYDRLAATFSDMQIITEGPLAPLNEKTIDHVAFSGGISSTSVRSLDARAETGRPRSDHFGVLVDFDWST